MIPFPLEVHLYHWLGLSAQFTTICSVELHCNSLHHNYTCRFLWASMMNLLSCVKCTLLCFLSNMIHWYISSSKSFWWLVLFSIWFSYVRISRRISCLLFLPFVNILYAAFNSFQSEVIFCKSFHIICIWHIILLRWHTVFFVVLLTVCYLADFNCPY